MVAEGIGKSLGLVEKFMEQDGFAGGGGGVVMFRFGSD